jgi:hypothetical protein
VLADGEAVLPEFRAAQRAYFAEVRDLGAGREAPAGRPTSSREP